MNSFRIEGGRVEVWRNIDEISQRAAELFVAVAREAIANKEKFSVALSGGTTPRLLLELLASEDHRNRIDWTRVHVFFSDERCVAPTEEESNYFMAREALLDHVVIPPEQIHRMRGELEPEQAAELYEQELREVFTESIPRFDLLLLGMGDDGHTASLFPGSDALKEEVRLTAAPFVEKFGKHRLTLTLPILIEAVQTIFMAVGPGKATALNAVLYPKIGQQRLPASLIQPRKGELLWLVDEAAATEL